MRNLTWLLLLANLGMLGWVLTQPVPQPERYRPIPVPPGVEPLVLLEERPVSVAAVDSPAPQKTAAPGNATPSEATAVGGASSDDKASPSEVESEPEPEPEQASGPADDSAAQQPAAPPPPPVCQTVGPFTTQDDASAISAQLAEHGYQPSLRNGEVRNPAGYWVYMSAMPAAEARRIVAELDANGMTDYFIGKQNYISLGIFSSKRKARTRLEQIERLGFEAVLDRRYRTRTVHWIDFEQGELVLLGSDLWGQIQSQHPDIRVQRISCE